jgi:2-oxoglutarate dehydrogenase E2 component (dihydrolipoamide succinyltransferase)
MRKAQGEAFEKANGIKLGFMSFFAKAAANALQRFPIINASVDGDDVIYHGYADISIAVATEKGLVTPVLRNVERMSFADVEGAIAGYAKKARDGKLGLEDLQGGTFTITNGGTFGSLMSTPIVNPPQSAILGMHAIKDRRERPGRDRADDVHRAQLRPPHHRRQGRGAIPGGHQEPAGKPAPHAARPVRSPT